MKFLEFGSCCGGGGTVTPAAEPAASPSQIAVAAPLKSRGTSRGGGRIAKPKLAPWKPVLSVISEEGAVSDKGSRNIGWTVTSQTKATKKARSTAADRSSSHTDDYRKDSMLMSLAAFSPTPYMI